VAGVKKRTFGITNNKECTISCMEVICRFADKTIGVFLLTMNKIAVPITNPRINPDGANITSTFIKLFGSSNTMR